MGIKKTIALFLGFVITVSFLFYTIRIVDYIYSGATGYGIDIEYKELMIWTLLAASHIPFISICIRLWNKTKGGY